MAKRAKPREPTRGETMCAWIKDRLAEGQTVYVQTPHVTIPIKPKHADLVRVHNGNCQVSRGKRWDIIDWTRVSARYSNPRRRAANPGALGWIAIGLGATAGIGAALAGVVFYRMTRM